MPIIIRSIRRLAWACLYFTLLAAPVAAAAQPTDSLYAAGNRAYQRGNFAGYTQALRAFQQGYAQAKRQGDRARQARGASLVGGVYDTIGDSLGVQLALRYYTEAHDLYAALRDSAAMARQLINQGVIFRKMGRTAASGQAYEAALALAQRVRATPQEIEARIELCDHYQKEGKYIRAERMLIEAEQSLNAAPDARAQMANPDCVELARIHLMRNIGRPQDALPIIERLLREGRTGSQYHRTFYYEQMEATYAAMGDYRRAHQWLRRAYAAADSVRNAAYNQELARMQRAEAGAAEERARRQAEEAHSRRRYFFIIAGLAVLAAAMTALAGWYYRAWRRAAAGRN